MVMWRVGLAGIVGTAVLLVAGCSDGSGSSTGARVRADGPPTATTTTVVEDDPMDARRVLEIARKAAEANGDTTPGAVEWVFTTLPQTGVLDGGDVVAADDDDTPVIVIQVHGDFENAGLSHPPPAPGDPPWPTPHATVIRVVLDTRTGEERAFAFTSVPADLSLVGDVHVAG